MTKITNYFFFLLFFILTACHQEKETLRLVDVNCDFKKQDIHIEKGISNPTIINPTDLIKGTNGLDYDFELALPQTIEYCGFIPIIMCSIGEPDTYYFTDKAMSKTYLLNIETNKNDQQSYESLMNYFRVYPDYEPNEDDLNRQAYQKDLEKKMGAKSKINLEKTKALIGTNQFYGQGESHYFKYGQVVSRYNIYGYLEDVFIHLKLIDYLDRDQSENIEELYCLIENLEIHKK